MNILTKFKDLLIESLKDNKKLIITLYIIFIIAIFASWMYSLSIISTVNLDDVSKTTPVTDDGKIDPVSIFTQNEISGILAYIGSIFFALGAIIGLLYNAFNIAAFGATFSVVFPNGGLFYIIYLIPHGIFELTSIVIQTAAGILLFLFIFKLIKGILKSDEPEFREKLSKSYEMHKKLLIQSLVLMVFVTILLIIAAPIESYLSVPIANFFVPI